MTVTTWSNAHKRSRLRCASSLIAAGGFRRPCLQHRVGFAATQRRPRSGAIAKIDAKAPSITLKSGKVKTFKLAKEFDVDALKEGEKVLVTYEMTNKKPTAST